MLVMLTAPPKARHWLQHRGIICSHLYCMLKPFCDSYNCIPGLGFSYGNIISSDDIEKEFDVSIRQVLCSHLLPLFPPWFQRTFGLSQFKQVQSKDPGSKASQPSTMSATACLTTFSKAFNSYNMDFTMNIDQNRFPFLFRLR